MAFDRRVGFVIAIDPDIERNGIAVIRKDRKVMEVATTATFPEVLELVKKYYAEWEGRYKANAPQSFMVWVEAGWLNKGNWHVEESRNGKYSPSAWAAAVGKNDGECSAVSKKLLECFEYYGIPCSPIRPLRKCWKGPDRKITHDELKRELEMYKVTHPIKGRSNQEVRDAALLAIVNL